MAKYQNDSFISSYLCNWMNADFEQILYNPISVVGTHLSNVDAVGNQSLKKQFHLPSLLCSQARSLLSLSAGGTRGDLDTINATESKVVFPPAGPPPPPLRLCSPLSLFFPPLLFLPLASAFVANRWPSPLISFHPSLSPLPCFLWSHFLSSRCLPPSAFLSSVFPFFSHSFIISSWAPAAVANKKWVGWVCVVCVCACVLCDILPWVSEQSVVGCELMLLNSSQSCWAELHHFSTCGSSRSCRRFFSGRRRHWHVARLLLPS